MTREEAYKELPYFAKERWSSIDFDTLRIVIADETVIEVLDSTGFSEQIVMDWLDVEGKPFMGYGPKTNVVIIPRRVIEEAIG